MKKRLFLPLAVLLSVLVVAATMLSAAGYDGTVGDVNGDGACDVADALLILRATLNGSDLPGGDINGDGKLSLIDVIKALKLAAAQPETETFTVTFVDYDDTVLKTEVVDSGADATAPENPTREGYRFDGWDGTYTAVTSDVTVTAKYVRQFTIRFVDYDGTEISTQTLDEGAAVKVPENPTRENYRFIGWDKTIVTATEDVTVTAQYIRRYTVVFVDHDDTVLKTEVVDSGTDATAPENPTREGYRFDGWDGTYTAVTSDVTVTAKYVRQFTVRFVDYDGTEIRTQTLDEGAVVEVPENPTRENYRFIGWDKTIVTATEDVTVTAQYIRRYTVVFVDHDDTVLKTEIVDSGADATAPENPTREGYRFDGWDGTYTAVTSDVTVTAKYVRQFTVRFVDHDGTTVLKTEVVDSGAAATAPSAPYHEAGYRFDGWDGIYTAVSGDMTVRAKCVKYFIIQYVDYDSTVLDYQLLDEGAEVTAPADPVRKNYRFTGWDRTVEIATEDMVITAQYIRQYTVTFADYGGAVLKTETVDLGDAVTPPADPSRDGYTFKGWDTQAYENVTEDIIVYAVYELNRYTVTFCMPDGSEIATDTVEHGYAASAPTPQAYYFVWEENENESTFEIGMQEFVGWDTAFNAVTSDLTVTAEYVADTDFDVPVLVMRFENNKDGRTAQIAMRRLDTYRVYALDFTVDYSGTSGRIASYTENASTPLIKGVPEGNLKITCNNDTQVLSFTSVSQQGLTIGNSTLLFNKLVLATDNQMANESIFRIGDGCVMVVDEGEGTPLRKVTPLIVYMK